MTRTDASTDASELLDSLEGTYAAFRRRIPQPARQHQLHLRGLQPGGRPRPEVLRPPWVVGPTADCWPGRAGRARRHRGPSAAEGCRRQPRQPPRLGPPDRCRGFGLSIDPAGLGLRPFEETYDELGPVSGQVIDLGERWETARVTRGAPTVPGRGRSRRACAPGGGLGLAHRPSSSGRMGRPLADGRVDGRRPPRDRHHQPVCRRPPVDPRGGRRVAPLRAARPAGTNRPAGPNDLDVGAPPDSRRDATPASLDAPAACPWRVTRPEGLVDELQESVGRLEHLLGGAGAH